MLQLLTKFAMLSSFAVFTLFVLDDWGGQLIGAHNQIWPMLDLPEQETSVPVWITVLGFILALLGLVCLAFAYAAIWVILTAGPTQDFRLLARRLQQLAYGLIGFWLFNNLIYGALRPVLARYLPAGEDFELTWDPFNPDLVFAIVAVAVLAIAKMMDRAWRAEDETQHFL